MKNTSELKRSVKQLREQANKLEREAISIETPKLCRQVAARVKNGGGNIAVFLGAGASKTFGWPLTNELLPKILVGLREDNLFEDHRINSSVQNKADRDLLRETLIALCPGIEIEGSPAEEGYNNLPLVTSLLSILDFSLASGQALIRGRSLDHIRDARVLLERAIYETIEHQDKETSPNYWPVRKPNKLTHQLVEWLDTIRPKPRIGIITYLISVWQHALKWLRDAEEWIVIGYSFPDEDLNIRSLFTRALASRSMAPHITAIQLTDNARPRYEAFFPKTQLHFINGGLEVFLNNAK